MAVKIRSEFRLESPSLPVAGTFEMEETLGVRVFSLLDGRAPTNEELLLVLAFEVSLPLSAFFKLHSSVPLSVTVIFRIWASFSTNCLKLCFRFSWNSYWSTLIRRPLSSKHSAHTDTNSLKKDRVLMFKFSSNEICTNEACPEMYLI